MSQGAFNKTITDAIIARARETLLSMGTTQLVTDRKTGKQVLSEDSLLNLENIRTTTDKATAGYQSIVTRGGLKGLAEAFYRYSERSELYKTAGDLFINDAMYDNFVKFVEEKYSKTNTKSTSSKKFRYTTLQTSAGNVRIGTSREDSEQDLIVFKNLNHGQLKSLFVDFLKASNTDSELTEFISKNLDAGHLSGVFNIRLRRLFNIQVATGSADSYRNYKVSAGTNQDLNDTFQKMLLLINDADFISSNIVFNIDLFDSASKDIYRKSGPSVAAELQLSIENQEAGRALATISRRMNELIIAADASKSRVDQVAAKQAVEGILKSLRQVTKLVESAAQRVLAATPSAEIQERLAKILENSRTVDSLLETRGSDSIMDSIGNTVANTIQGKSIPAAETTRTKGKAKLTKPGGKKKSSPQPYKKAPKVKAPTFNKVPAVRPSTSLSLITLLNYINTNLANQIKMNMGTGNSTQVLNYRTGRLAESAEVRNVSESRSGMITAFYTYMKNPYATFSQGGRQEMPRSRDPKLLISKSIRELLQDQVGNRLRAVLI